MPPGQGKAATHERNQRRRRARQLKKHTEEEISTIPPTPPINGDDRALLNEISTTTFTNPGLPVPAMSNRNKKKGFLKEMMTVRGTKTVFGQGEMLNGRENLPVDAGEEDAIHTPSKPNGYINRVGNSSSNKRKFVRVIAPSQLEVIPNNVFVSSMEFSIPRRRADGRRETNSDHASCNDEEMSRQGAKEGNLLMGAMTVDQTATMPNGYGGGEIVDASQEDLLWIKVGVAFDALEDLTPALLSQMEQGTLLAWKVRSKWLGRYSVLILSRKSNWISRHSLPSSKFN